MKIILPLLLLPFFSQAFTLTGAEFVTGFNDSDVAVYYNSSQCPAGFYENLQFAIQLWNSASTSQLKLNLFGTTSTAVADFRQFSFTENLLVGCSNDFATDSADSSGSDGCTGSCLDTVGGASRQRILTTGVIEKSYVIVNVNSSSAANFANQADSNQKSILAHELGHALGLGHSDVEAALMYYSTRQLRAVRLHQDDIDGISYLYPSDAIQSCGEIRSHQEGPFNGQFLVLFLFPLLLWLGFKKPLKAFKIINC